MGFKGLLDGTNHPSSIGWDCTTEELFDVIRFFLRFLRAKRAKHLRLDEYSYSSHGGSNRAGNVNLYGMLAREFWQLISDRGNLAEYLNLHQQEFNFWTTGKCPRALLPYRVYLKGFLDEDLIRAIASELARNSIPFGLTDVARIAEVSVGTINDGFHEGLVREVRDLAVEARNSMHLRMVEYIHGRTVATVIRRNWLASEFGVTYKYFGGHGDLMNELAKADRNTRHFYSTLSCPSSNCPSGGRRAPAILRFCHGREASLCIRSLC
jgi:hypothetical protein